MYAIRKYDKPKTMKIKKIVPDMGKLGPLFKNKAGQIKELLEKMDVKSERDIVLKVDGKDIKIPKDCYKIVESEEKQFGEKFVPHVIEPSFGIDRIIYMVLEHNYVETKKKGEEYKFLKFKAKVAPIKVGVFPLISNKKLSDVACNIDKTLREAGIITCYDEGGTIGRRYARMDEVGTPYCITVDHDTIDDESVTIRDRDTTKQERIKIDRVVEVLRKNLE